MIGRILRRNLKKIVFACVLIACVVFAFIYLQPHIVIFLEDVQDQGALGEFSCISVVRVHARCYIRLYYIRWIVYGLVDMFNASNTDGIGGWSDMVPANCHHHRLVWKAARLILLFFHGTIFR